VLDRVERWDLRREPPPGADTVAANLTRPLLLEVAARMETAPRGLIVSGLLEEEAEVVAAAFRPLRVRDRRANAGWAALALGP
jgi:ribosomal protein L11 methyltransferase